MNKLAWFLTTSLTASAVILALGVLRTGCCLYGYLLFLSHPFCVSIPRYFSVQTLGLEDSENVCSDCQWCYCVNIGLKCKRRWRCVSFFWPFSPSSLFTVLVPSPPPPPVVFLHLFVVPVHSIRLEYGCAVVDTCSLWLVSKCCCLMMCCSSWCHQIWSSD